MERMPFGSSCFLFLFTHSHNRMPLAPHVFSVLTEQDALGSSQNRMPLAPHVVVLVELPNVNFCSKNTEYGKQLSAPQVCNCAKSFFLLPSKWEVTPARHLRLLLAVWAMKTCKSL